jgi:hypothetical protein
VILVSEGSERGFQLVRSTRNEDGGERFTSLLVGRSADDRFLDVDVAESGRNAAGLTAIVGFESAWAWLAHHTQEPWVRTWQAEQPCHSRETVNAFYTRYLGARAALLAAVNGWLPQPGYFAPPERLTDEEFTRRLAELTGASVHQFLTAACAFSLLNCRNVVLRPHTPSLALQKARARRGQLPLVSYSEILVRAFAAKGERRAGLHGDSLHAVHWVRGHCKRYTEERPLFGNAKNVGAFWWQPHLVGKDKSHRVESTYRLSIPTSNLPLTEVAV